MSAAETAQAKDTSSPDGSSQVRYAGRMPSPPLRIQVVGDLHVDFAPTALSLAAGADVLVVAGDTCEGVERGFDWLRAVVPMSMPIVSIAGNHEYYRRVLTDEVARARETAPTYGISFLENASAVIGGVRFLGCTLWTDYALNGEPSRTAAMATAREWMNDHRQIMMPRQSRDRFMPRDALAIHRVSRAWLERELAFPFRGPTVVVTHHAPSRRSLGAVQRPSSLGPCLASDLDALVASSGAALWIHGHTHRCCDYRIGDTRVVNNGRGYGDEAAGVFDPVLVLDVPR